MRASSRRSGFTLMEVAIAIAVIAILAGTAIPLVLKSVNQAREQRIRAEMKLLWESAFGSADRQVANMRTDFGFDPAIPTSSFTSFPKATNRSAVPGATPPAYPAAASGAPFNWGWNGAYWLGSTRSIGGQQVPVDPWGRPYLIRRLAGGSYQILCRGLNGINDTAYTVDQPTQDDYVYPLSSVNIATQSGGTVVVSVLNKRATTLLNVRVSFSTRLGATYGAPPSGGNLAVKTPLPSDLNPDETGKTVAVTLPQGVSSVSVTVGGVQVANEVFELAPGASRVLSYIIH